MSHTTLSRLWPGLLGGVILTLAALPLPGWAQQPQAQPSADPPGRVAYVSALEGGAQLAPSATGDAQPAALNWPVTTGNRITTGPDSHAELDAGSVALRLPGQTHLDITLLDDAHTQLALTAGALSARVRQLQPDERLEVDTPQLAVVASQPGEYRVDVDAAAGTTRVAVRSGQATVYGGAGESATVASGQQTTFTGRALAVARQGAVSAPDALDQWAAGRDALGDPSDSAQYVAPGMPGAQLLAHTGQWTQDATYGAVWYPAVAADWAPYRQGRWVWVDPWGWTWVDDAPWGFAPFHYGRWAQIGPRWAWVPGPLGYRPVYAPALVGFVGGADWGVSVDGLPAAGWFPLAPGEYWRPGYRVSDRYRERLNFGISRPAASFTYRYQRHPGAVSIGSRVGGPGGMHRFAAGSSLHGGALGSARRVSATPRGAVSPALRSTSHSAAGLNGTARHAVVSSRRGAVPSPTVRAQARSHPAQRAQFTQRPPQVTQRAQITQTQRLQQRGMFGGDPVQRRTGGDWQQRTQSVQPRSVTPPQQFNRPPSGGGGGGYHHGR